VTSTSRGPKARWRAANLTPKDVGHRILNPAPPWEAEVRYYRTLRQVLWNVLFPMDYGQSKGPVTDVEKVGEK